MSEEGIEVGDLVELAAIENDHDVIIWHDDWQMCVPLGYARAGELVIYLGRGMTGPPTGVRVLSKHGVGRVITNRIREFKVQPWAR